MKCIKTFYHQFASDYFLVNQSSHCLFCNFTDPEALTGWKMSVLNHQIQGFNELHIVQTSYFKTNRSSTVYSQGHRLQSANNNSRASKSETRGNSISVISVSRTEVDLFWNRTNFHFVNVTKVSTLDPPRAKPLPF